MKDIVLFGVQGSGKGTQGKIIAKKYGYTIFETGEELRKLIASDSVLGNKIKSIVESGNLVDTSVIIEVVQNFLSNISKDQRVLFDGLPRKMDQKKAFDELMRNVKREYIGILIKISQSEAEKRLTSRRACKVCKEIYPAFYSQDVCEKCAGELIVRQDDSDIEAIKNRLHAFQAETMPVIESYCDAMKMIIIDGEQSIGKVTEDLIIKLDKKLV